MNKRFGSDLSNRQKRELQELATHCVFCMASRGCKVWDDLFVLMDEGNHSLNPSLFYIVYKLYKSYGTCRFSPQQITILGRALMESFDYEMQCTGK